MCLSRGRVTVTISLVPLHIPPDLPCSSMRLVFQQNILLAFLERPKRRRTPRACVPAVFMRACGRVFVTVETNAPLPDVERSQPGPKMVERVKETAPGISRSPSSLAPLHLPRFGLIHSVRTFVTSLLSRTLCSTHFAERLRKQTSMRLSVLVTPIEPPSRTSESLSRRDPSLAILSLNRTTTSARNQDNISTLPAYCFVYQR